MQRVLATGVIDVIHILMNVSCMPDRLQDVSLKLPVIYLLDCTFNDCSHIFKTMNKVFLFI